MMRQDRFTEQAQEVLQQSRRWCASSATPSGTSSTSSSLCLQHPDGLASRVVERLGVDVEGHAPPRRRVLARTPKLRYDVVQIYTTPRIVRMLETANAEAERLKDEFVGVEHLLIAIADERDGDAARILREFGIDKERIYRALQEVRGTARVDRPRAESQLPGAGEVQRRPHGGGASGQARPRHRPRGRDPARHADPQPAHQEQPGDHR